MPSSLNGSFPLHLLYSFDEPGIYSVRLAAHENGAVVFQSDWTDIEIQPFSEEKRDAMLKSLAGQTHVRNAEYVMGSLLSWPDEKALAVLKAFLPVTHQIACANYDCIRMGAAMAALAGFDPQLLRRESVQTPR